MCGQIYALGRMHYQQEVKITKTYSAVPVAKEGSFDSSVVVFAEETSTSVSAVPLCSLMSIQQENPKAKP